MTWTPSDVVVENLGRFQVVIGGTDLTIYRDVVTEVLDYSSSEPFDDKVCTIQFPGITSYESLDDLPFREFDDVEIWLISPTNERVDCLWEGMVGSLEDELTAEGNPLTVECLGALYQADLFLKQPAFGFTIADVGQAIATELNLRSKHYGLRLNQMNWLAWTSVLTRTLGSWSQLLTGWIQELLSTAYSNAFMADNENATAVVAGPGNGYWVVGDYGSVCSFGDRMPNFGSLTTWTSIFVHLFNDVGLYVSDVEWNVDKGWGMLVSRDGHVGAYSVANPGDIALNPWWGDRRGSDPSQPFVAINTSTNAGYRIVNTLGQVFCFAGAAFYGDSPPLTSRALSSGQVIPDAVIDMVTTPSGNGYWLITWTGKIHAYGDATPMADFPFTDAITIAATRDLDGTGLWGLDVRGRVSTRGTAVNHGSPTLSTTSSHYRDIQRSYSGEGYIVVRDDGDVFTFGDQAHLGTAKYSEHPSAGGNIAQFTLHKAQGRTPLLETKNTWTTHWTVTVGTPGVTHSLSRDRTTAYNTFYGEGTDSNNCKWRNSRYPNFPVSVGEYTPPLWPGYYMSERMNERAEGVRTWQNRMLQAGWPIEVDGIFDAYDANMCRFMQTLAGIQADGIIGPQTWAVTFQPGATDGDLKSAYIAPLVIDPRVEPFRYTASGSISGPNPNFDARVPRIETWSNYGERSSKREARISARHELKRNADPGYVGTMTFVTDPEEGSRIRIKAGQNILYKGYRGGDVLLHVAEAKFNIENLTMEVTVDSKARDLMTVNAILERNRELGNAPLAPTRPQNSRSKQTQDDTVVWDCESRAGYVPEFWTPPNGLWTVIRIPFGELGTVVKAEFETAPATVYSIAVFDRKVSANQMGERGNPTEENYWKEFPEDWGLLQAWGGSMSSQEQMCGFYPGIQSDDDPITGRFVDAQSWNYWSSQPPWVWVAIWTFGSTRIKGRFYPGADTGFNFGGIDAMANPMEIHQTKRPGPAYFEDTPWMGPW